MPKLDFSKSIQLRKNIVRWWQRFNHPYSIVLLLGHNSRARSFSFRPLSTLVVLVILLLLVGAAGIVLAKFSNNTWQINHMSRELLAKEGEVDRLERDISELNSLFTNLEQTLSQFSEITSFSETNVNEVGDINQLRNYEGVTLFPEESSKEQQLQNIRFSLEKTLEPLRKTITTLQREKNILSDLPTTWPVGLANNINAPGGHISFFFGPSLDPISRRIWYLHRGLDIAYYPAGLPIKAAANGRVIEARYEANGYGNFVLIRHKYGYSTRYAHMIRSTVKVGQLVNQGDVIGYMGSTGRSTGPHLHFEIRSGDQLVDPLLYLHMSKANNSIIDRTLNAIEGRPFPGGTDGIY